MSEHLEGVEDMSAGEKLLFAQGMRRGAWEREREIVTQLRKEIDRLRCEGMAGPSGVGALSAMADAINEHEHQTPSRRIAEVAREAERVRNASILIAIAEGVRPTDFLGPQTVAQELRRMAKVIEGGEGG